MIIIAHRGNLRGRIPDQENSPNQLRQALDLGFWLEIDLWWAFGGWWAGHSAATHRIEFPEWDRDDVIFHLKTPRAPAVENADYFCIGQDPFSLTWNGMFWMNYGQEPHRYGIMCAPELVGALEELEHFVYRCFDAGAAGICTDYPLAVREMLR